MSILKIFDKNKKDVRVSEKKEETSRDHMMPISRPKVTIQNKNLFVLKRAWPSEKAARLQEKRQYTFIINERANKNIVRDAIQQKFGVVVEKVNIIRHKGKIKRVGKLTGTQSGFKKATATLKEGQKIDII